MKKTYFIKTFGCAMNVSDSERIDSFMLSSGFLPAEEISKANIVIINTCGVRQMAEDRVFGLVRNLKKKNKKIKIVVTGCLANRKDIHRRMKDVDLFSEIKDIENILEKIGFKKETTFEYSRDYLKIIPKHKNSFQAFVPIMTGCDNFCSYCVVPYARGREISRPANEIISEIKDLVKKGYKSITLLGQNVNSYKGVISNQKPATSKNPELANYELPTANYLDFSQLLRKIDSIPGKFWIYFVSSHPKDMDNKTIEVISKLKKVCENIHLPLQAGDDEILRRMNRKYTSAEYLKKIRKIKSSFAKNKPSAPYSISTDIIVGFPGETKSQFENSAEIMRKAKFDMVFFGQYSPRPGTAAWKMKDTVSKKEKEGREKYLNEILKKTALENNKKYLGKKIEVLIEKQALANKNKIESESELITYFGKTRTLKNVKMTIQKNRHPELAEGSQNLVGKIVKCEITKTNIWNLEGVTK